MHKPFPSLCPLSSAKFLPFSHSLKAGVIILIYNRKTSPGMGEASRSSRSWKPCLHSRTAGHLVDSGFYTPGHQGMWLYSHIQDPMPGPWGLLDPSNVAPAQLLPLTSLSVAGSAWQEGLSWEARPGWREGKGTWRSFGTRGKRGSYIFRPQFKPQIP